MLAFLEHTQGMPILACPTQNDSCISLFFKVGDYWGFCAQEGHVFQEGRNFGTSDAFRVEVVFFLPRPSETYVALPAVVILWTSKSRMDFPLKTAATRKRKTLSFFEKFRWVNDKRCYPIKTLHLKGFKKAKPVS